MPSPFPSLSLHYLFFLLLLLFLLLMFLLSALFLGLCVNAAQAVPMYRVFDLGFEALAINKRGKIVGVGLA